jgi:hypothetical protein
MIEALGSEFFETLNKERIKRKIYTYALWPESSVVSLDKHPYIGYGPEFYREIRVAPKGVDCDFAYWAFEDYVAFVSPKHEAFGFVVQSKALVQMLNTQWQFIWNLSTPFTDDSDAPAEFIKSLSR